MKNRKGAGYIIESIISIIVLLTFVAGSYSGIGSDHDWVGFEQQTATSDLTYTLKKTEHFDNFVGRGETGAIRGVSASLMDQRVSAAGTVTGLPTGTYLIGVYSDQDPSESDRVSDTSLQDATDGSPGDRCVGDLEEIRPDEGTILRTSSSGDFETNHMSSGSRLYFADADPGTSGTDEVDYDSVWVDNRTSCQFTRDEGPYRINDFISLDGNAYKIKTLTDSKAVLERSDLSYELKQDFKQLESADIEVRRFNSSDNFDEYDLLVFKHRENLNDLNGFESKLLDYMENGKAVFAMALQQSDLRSGFLDETGLKWVDMNFKLPLAFDGLMFGNGNRGQQVESYFNHQGFTTDDIAISPNGRISSGERYTRDEQIVASADYTYNRTEWDSSNDSMETTTVQPVGTPSSDCADPYRNGSFEFPEGESGSETLTAYSIQLSGTGCSSFEYGVAIDKTGDGSGNPDGEFDDRGEGTYLNESTLIVNQRLYQVKINSHDNVTFDFVGDRRTEVFSYVNDLETQSSEGFGRFPIVSGTDPQKHIALLSSSIFMMLDDERSFGPDDSSSISTTTAGRTPEGDVYSLNLRWLE
ncbi:hypothetical protein [Candidatus Nanohalococcus occultus]|uniref:Uncharacterized protein n=1 Tax=Candidatus Nanohalococcus occultus TaxID=2978047 RepID=A0ABY8CJM0_9ARCH|nr:hypothetical protein SVXNc_0832 [Candidatus Nanohaloarchaeota archaeon SVXNc]